MSSYTSTFPTTSAQIAALITDETGTGSLVLATSPTLVTPVLGVATGTSLTLTTDDASNTAVTNVLKISHTSSAAPGNGIGVGFQFEVETSAGNNEIGAVIEAVATDVTSTSEEFNIVFKTMFGGAAAAERVRIDNYGAFLINQSSDYLIESSHSHLALSYSDAVDWAAFFHEFSNTNGAGGFNFTKSRNATFGSHTVLQSGDISGAINWYGSDGTNYIRMGQIRMEVDGTPGTDDMPGRLLFSTTPDGSSAFAERMRIDNSGNIIALSATTTPPTLSTNGQWVMTPTSNTNMRISYRGSDGTTRVANITLA